MPDIAAASQAVEQAAKEAAPAPVENGAGAENGNGASVQALPPAWPVQLA